MHAHSALSTCLPPPSIPLLYIKTKKKTKEKQTKKPITRFFTTKFKCIQLHGLIYSFLCVWTCLASLVEIDTRLLFSFLAACCQNLNETSEGARLHHHALKEKGWSHLQLVCFKVPVSLTKVPSSVTKCNHDLPLPIQRAKGLIVEKKSTTAEITGWAGGGGALYITCMFS